MIDIELTREQLKVLEDIGFWLDATMPNPPLPDTQRWELGYDDTRTRTGIRFFNEHDATIFKLRW